MTDFNEIKYERIDFDKTKTNLENLINQLKSADDFESYISIVQRINAIHLHREEMFDYADIRNMRDLTDEYYKKEIEYWNSLKPKFDLLFLPFYNEMNHSKFKELLLKSVPNNFFEIIKYQTRITSDKNLELLKKENDLKTRYRNLNKTKILYNGEEKTIGFISGLFSAKNRSTRKKAHDAINDFYYQYVVEQTKIENTINE